ncbi:MAG: type II secretion system protein [Pseudomonadales bacterium]
MKHARGFTFIELIIVVFIIGVLSAIIVPQLSTDGLQDREAALRARLNALRQAIYQYEAEHGEYPGVNATVASSCSGTTYEAGTTERGFWLQLQMYSNVEGQVCSKQDEGAFPFGPYIQTSGALKNPVNGSDHVTVISGGSYTIVADGPNRGWKYDNVVGVIIPNDESEDSLGNRYDSY